MAYYRLYLIRNDRFIAVEDIDAEDDIEAVGMARQRVEDSPAELWSGTRKVNVFNTVDG